MFLGAHLVYDESLWDVMIDVVVVRATTGLMYSQYTVGSIIHLIYGADLWPVANDVARALCA